MDSFVVATVAGILGTLLAPLVSQYGASRQQAVEDARDARQRNFDERRTAYTEMNRASRYFHTLLKDALHRIRDGVYSEEDRHELEVARRDYRDRYAAAQMIVPERVLTASREVNVVLAGADAATKRIDRGLAVEDETTASVLSHLKEAEARLTSMMRLMREDLGVPT